MSNKIHKGYGKLVQWADELKAEVFGTLTFRQQLKLHEVDAQANEFFNKLDRAFFGANYKRKGKRIKRIVVRQVGRTRTNAHIHFIANLDNIVGYTTEEVMQIMEWIWYNKIKGTRKVKLKRNMFEAVKDERAVSRYVFKEWAILGNDTISTKATYI